MIAHLNGKITAVYDDNNVVIDVNGVGYSLICSSRVISKYIINSNVSVFTELVVRETGWTLYGFDTFAEKQIFNLLSTVKGVGGKVAIAILSALTDSEIKFCLLNEDKKLLRQADGVGEHLAIRIIAELKSKSKKFFKDFVCGDDEQNIPQLNSVNNDVISALVGLGYAKSDILKALSADSVRELKEFESMFKETIKILSSRNF